MTCLIRLRLKSFENDFISIVMFLIPLLNTFTVNPVIWWAGVCVPVLIHQMMSCCHCVCKCHVVLQMAVRCRETSSVACWRLKWSKCTVNDNCFSLEGYCLLACNAMLSDRSVPAFWRNVLPPFLSFLPWRWIQHVSPKTFLMSYQTAQCYFPEDINVHSHHCENFVCFSLVPSHFHFM